MITTSTNNQPSLDPIPLKNTVAIMNLVVTRAVDFINKFYAETEKKILALEQRVEKLDTLLMLLEKKLDSIPPELINIPDTRPQFTQPQITSVQQPQVQAPQQTVTTQQQTQPQPQPQTQLQPPVQTQQQPVNNNVQEQNPPVQEVKEPEVDLEREKYVPYIKMFKIGVPLQAVRIKMQAEGIDPAGIEKYIDITYRPG